MASYTLLVSNPLGEAQACPCGGVRLRLAGSSVHIAAADVSKLVHLSHAAQAYAHHHAAHAQAHRTSAPTPSHQAWQAVPQMTPMEAARFGQEGPVRPGPRGPQTRTLH